MFEYIIYGCGKTAESEEECKMEKKIREGVGRGDRKFLGNILMISGKFPGSREMRPVTKSHTLLGWDLLLE